LGKSNGHFFRAVAAGWLTARLKDYSMRKTQGRFSQHSESYASSVDTPRVERAISELLRLATQVGISGSDLIAMLNRGVSIAEILSILEVKAQGRSH
jgi:hypothetical protein